MSRKSKLIISIILLFVGVGAIPTGFYVNQYLVDQVYEAVPEALLGIQEEALPSIEEQLPGLATPDVLLGIEEKALITLESQLPVLTTPDVLLGLKAEIEDKIPALINCTTAANVINGTVDLLVQLFGLDAGTNIFFNDPTFQADIGGGIILKGVSNYTGASMGYTLTARQTLLYDGISIPTVADVPGLINDTILGTGVCGFLEIYNASLYNMVLNQTIQTLYNATWPQLTAVAGWLQFHVFPDVVPGAFFGKYGIPVSTAEAFGFYFQWANGTLIEDGIDLSVFLETYDTELKGFEAGVPIHTNISLATCINMWDPTNQLSFVNETGIFAWLNASYQTTIEFVFGINTAQYLLVLDWLNNFITNLTPIFLYEETGYTVPELAQLAFYEQWADGTIQGEAVLPDGFLNELDPSFAGTPYFEVGLTTGPTGLSVLQASDLWDESNVYSLVNSLGIMIWLEALTNTTLYLVLEGEFSLSAGQRTMLLTWLAAFYAVRIPQLLEYETGFTVPELAQFAFYEQWANGTMNGLPVLTEGFLSMLDPPIYGPPFFEVGLTEGSTGLTVLQCGALWDETSQYSLVSSSGINKWYDAEPGNTIYDSLKLNNAGISDTQMSALLDWLPQFRDIIVNKLAKTEEDLPMEPYDLGNAILIGLASGGSVLAILGLVVLILSRRK